MKSKRTARLLGPGMRAYFIVYLLFFIGVLWVNHYVALVGLLLLVAQYLVFRNASVKRRKEILALIDSVASNIGDVTTNSVSASPFPTVIIRVETGEVIWCNDLFHSITGERRHTFEIKLTDIIPDIDVRWIMEGRNVSQTDLILGDRIYELHGNSATVEGRTGVFGTIYFIDVTDIRHTRRRYEETRPVVAVVLIDNYDEIIKSGSANDNSKLLIDLDDMINQWAEEAGFLLRKYDRDRYLVLMEQKDLRALKESQFSILEEAKSLFPEPMPLTLSIGIGVDGENYAENLSYSLLAIDMALSRGGDQAIIKNKRNFEFYGGQTQEFQKRTKVKSRVMANALSQLIKDSGNVMVMSHKLSDLDSIGSAAGIVCASRKLDKKAYIVVDRENTAAGQLLDRLDEQPEYKDVIISPTDAILKADSGTLLIVTDVNRPHIVESEELLLSCNRIAVIDHHRRGATYIDNAALNFHEPYASSASELVSELLSYMSQDAPILKAEAEAMLAGIVLDTKNFTMRTGVRTFEAAARLRNQGADPVEIKRLFQTDFESCVDRYNIVSHANLYREGISIAVSDRTVDRTTAAQAADELLNVQGVQASFVLFPEEDETIISARSLGKVNVQVILEKMGGGGHLNMAGAQIKGRSPEVVLSRLYDEIDEYLDK